MKKLYLCLVAVGVPFSVGIMLMLFGYLPAIPPSIFEGLLQTVSILLGLTPVVIFFYLGRIETLEQQYLTTVRKSYILLGRFAHD
jgi:hypothetical protein